MFKLYGEVNSSKNTAMNIWLNDGVYWQWKKLHVSAYSGHLQVLTTFLLKDFYITCLDRVVMFRSHHHFILLATKLSKPDDGCYRPKHVVFYCQ